jgi:hypothetical protein
MWTTILFSSAAALFLSMTAVAFIHQRWAKRLPALTALPAIDTRWREHAGALLGGRGGAR